MDYQCVLVRLYDDGKVEVEQNLYFNYAKELNLEYNGYITLIMEEEFYTDVYVVSKEKGTLKAYLEGFLIGRNIDYVTRSDFSSSDGYSKLVNNAYQKLVVKE